MKIYISFILSGYSRSGLTKIWNILSIDNNDCLGTIKWFPNWRKYCFYPSNDCVFEQDCLRVISNFIESETTLHKIYKEVSSETAKEDNL
jgi:hypothetical protein